jgi:6-phosphogluconolactonase
LQPGAGPRHFEFHNHGRVLYVINELNSTISTFEKRRGIWEEIQTVATLPDEFTGENYCADIHASHDGRFLYGSNRGHNSIAVFRIDQNNAMLTRITSVPVQGDWPRNFTLSPDGKFMLVANQRSGNITVFQIDPENGVPVFTGKSLDLPAPVCLEFF